MNLFGMGLILAALIFAPDVAAQESMKAQCIPAPAGAVEAFSSEKIPMDFTVRGITPYDTRVLLHEMKFFAAFTERIPSPSRTAPVDHSSYTIDFGDGQKSAPVFYGANGGANSLCLVYWMATHAYTKPGRYTAVLFRDDEEIAKQKFLIFASSF